VGCDGDLGERPASDGRGLQPLGVPTRWAAGEQAAPHPRAARLLADASWRGGSVGCGSSRPRARPFSVRDGEPLALVRGTSSRSPAPSPSPRREPRQTTSSCPAAAGSPRPPTSTIDLDNRTTDSPVGSVPAEISEADPVRVTLVHCGIKRGTNESKEQLRGLHVLRLKRRPPVDRQQHAVRSHSSHDRSRPPLPHPCHWSSWLRGQDEPPGSAEGAGPEFFDGSSLNANPVALPSIVWQTGVRRPTLPTMAYTDSDDDNRPTGTSCLSARRDGRGPASVGPW
jgi:hypothetical protein